jgi:hypothetical protein
MQRPFSKLHNFIPKHTLQRNKIFRLPCDFLSLISRFLLLNKALGQHPGTHAANIPVLRQSGASPPTIWKRLFSRPHSPAPSSFFLKIKERDHTPYNVSNPGFFIAAPPPTRASHMHEKRIPAARRDSSRGFANCLLA